MREERILWAATPRQASSDRKPRTMKKFKPILVTAAIAIAAVYVWNRFVSRKLDSTGKLDA